MSELWCILGVFNRTNPCSRFNNNHRMALVFILQQVNCNICFFQKHLFILFHCFSYSISFLIERIIIIFFLQNNRFEVAIPNRNALISKKNYFLLKNINQMADDVGSWLWLTVHCERCHNRWWGRVWHPTSTLLTMGTHLYNQTCDF